MYKSVLLLCVTLGLVIFSSAQENLYELSVVHMNDFHARFDEISVDSGLCKSSDCIGGFSRLYTSIGNCLRKKPNAIILNAGDNFEGTQWYTLFRWNVTQYFFNTLPIDAYTLGNHEFEDGIQGLIPFMKHLKSPVVVANIDASKEPEFEGLFNKSIVLIRNGRKIGIIGVLLSTIRNIGANVGNLILTDEIEAINAEAERLVKEEGVFANIVLSHCGYMKEMEIARKSGYKIALVVGSHSHTFLYTGVPKSNDIPAGSYPTIVKNRENKTVLVVQAGSYGKYLGNLSVFLNELGDVVSWEGEPIYQDNSIPKDEIIDEELAPWKKEIDQIKSEIVGKTLVRLDQNICQQHECLMGNFLADSMIFEHLAELHSNSWCKIPIAVTQGGGIRAGIDRGDVSYEEVMLAEPFNNTIDTAEILGEDLKKILEESVKDNINLLQVSGLKIRFNLKEPIGSRVTSVKVRCCACKIPKYENLELDRIYGIALHSFLVGGGAGFSLFPKVLKNVSVGRLESQIYLEYLGKKSPLFLEIEGRIIFEK